MVSKEFILNDIEKHPLAWVLECPKCGSTVNAKFALALSPELGLTYILPYFYCHCNRFQLMEPRPIKLMSYQVILITISFFHLVLTGMTNYILKRQEYYPRPQVEYKAIDLFIVMWYDQIRIKRLEKINGINKDYTVQKTFK